MRLLSLLAAVLIAASVPARAGEWIVTVGGEARYGSKFEGSDDQRLSAIPKISVRRASDPFPFWMPSDGASITLLTEGASRAGVTFNLVGRRDAVPGFGPVAYTLEAGVFLEAWPLDFLRFRGEIRQGVMGGHAGQIGTLSAALVVPLGSHLKIGVGPKLSFSSRDYNQSYFGADGGFRSAGVEGIAIAHLNQNWSIYGTASYDRYLAGISRSTLVELGDSGGFTVGIGVLYSFSVPMPF